MTTETYTVPSQQHRPIVHAATDRGKTSTRSTDEGRGDARPQHRRGEDTRVPKTQPGGRDTRDSAADGCRTGSQEDQRCWKERHSPAALTRGGDASTKKHRRGEKTRQMAAQTVTGQELRSTKDGGERGAHPQHRRGEDARGPKPQTGGKDTRN